MPHIPERIKKAGVSVQNWYGHFERPISSLSLIGGFVFDALTLERVDRFWENLWVVGHFVIVAICMAWVHRVENEPGDEANPQKAHFWLVNVIQFFFGGLLSTFLVFYFRSSDIAASWPFILILALAFWANESLKKHFVRLTFQVSLFYLSLFSFTIFLLPVVTHEIGAGIFILSGILSLALMFGFLHILLRASGDKFYESSKNIFISIGAIFVIMNVLYFTNLIPPIPLSVKASGLYHSIQKVGAGGYAATYEDLGWRKYFQLHDDFHILPGEPIYAYSAVFAPTDLNITIVHRWQYYDGDLGKWVDYGEVALPVYGGRDNGFRTYSTKSGLPAGNWRINVETQRGQLIGRLRFNLIIVGSHPKLETKVLE